MNNITQKIVGLMSDLDFDIDSLDKAPRDVIFRKDTEMDSLDKVELIIECEKEFKLSIHDEDAVDIETVGQLSDYIENKISTKSSTNESKN